MAKDNHLLKKILEKSNRFVLDEIKELRKVEVIFKKIIEKNNESFKFILF